jgi:hypothetical protein
MSEHQHPHDDRDDHADVDDHGHGHGDVAVEESGLPNLSILGFVVLTAVVFFGTAASLPSLFYRVLEHIRHGQVSAKATELSELRTVETERLGTYGYVDKEKGIVHIPIEVAMQKVVEDAKK